jgi:hypothetical protein
VKQHVKLTTASNYITEVQMLTAIHISGLGAVLKTNHELQMTMLYFSMEIFKYPW